MNVVSALDPRADNQAGQAFGENRFACVSDCEHER
jgi:hypothetical protein